MTTQAFTAEMLAAPTPGHRFLGRPVRVEIKVVTTKNGTRRATYYSRPAGRWLPMPLAEAEILLVQGLVDHYSA